MVSRISAINNITHLSLGGIFLTTVSSTLLEILRDAQGLGRIHKRGVNAMSANLIVPSSMCSVRSFGSSNTFWPVGRRKRQDHVWKQSRNSINIPSWKPSDPSFVVHPRGKVVESGSSAGSTTSTKVGNSTGCDCNISWRLHPCYDHHSRGIIFGRLGDTSFHSIFRFHTHFQVTMKAEFILHPNTGLSYFKCWFHIHMSHSVAFCNLSGTEGHLVATHFHPGITRFWIANERIYISSSWFYVSHMNEVGTLPWNWNWMRSSQHVLTSWKTSVVKQSYQTIHRILPLNFPSRWTPSAPPPFSPWPHPIWKRQVKG